MRHVIVPSEGLHKHATPTAAGEAITLSVTNKGKTPAEFESKRLRAETVIAPGATVTIKLRALPKGSYAFFDEFYPDNAKSRGEIVAQ